MLFSSSKNGGKGYFQTFKAPCIKKKQDTVVVYGCFDRTMPLRRIIFWLKLLIYCLDFHQIRAFYLLRTFNIFFPRMSFHSAKILKVCNFIEKGLHGMRSPGNFTKFYRIPFQKQAIADILLYKYS